MDVQYQVLAGDPGIVETKGKEYQEIAEAISRSVRTLDDIVDQVDQKSLAMDATRDLAGDVASDIRKVTERYRETGDALVAYASELRRTKDASTAPAQAIATLEGDLATWQSRVSSRQDAYDSAVAAGEETDIEYRRKRLHTAEDQVTLIEGQLETQRRLWETARDEKAVAATTAINAIIAVTEGDKADGVNDSFWDKVGAVASVAWDVLKVICDVAAILSIFLAWVPGLGQVLLVLAAIGAIMAIVDAAIKFAKGEGSFGDLLLAVVVGVLSLYGGKLIGMAAQRLRTTMTLSLRGPLGGSLINATGRGATLSRVQTAFPSYGQGFLGALKSPFVRSPADMARMLRFQQGEAFSSVLKSALSQGNPFKLKNLFKWDEDVADIYHLTTNFAEYFDAAVHNKANLLVMAEFGFSTYEMIRSGVSISDAITGGDALGGIGTGSGHLAGPVPAIVGGGARLANDLLKLDAPGTD